MTNEFCEACGTRTGGYALCGDCSQKPNSPEYEFLLWFYQNADFGPADGDVRYFMRKAYKATGKPIPEGYGFGRDDDEDGDDE